MTDGHQPSEEKEKRDPLRELKWVFRVLYSPVKAFNEIVKKPSIAGPILILLMMLVLNLGVQYASLERFLVEIPTPDSDQWTEEPASPKEFVWSSNGDFSFSGSDYLAGNNSVESSVTNSSFLWMHLANIGTFDCLEEYTRLSFRVKWVSEASGTPIATLQLFSSGNESRKFELNVNGLIANSTNTWANVSVDLATDNWSQVNSPVLSNVTGIGVLLEWATPADLTLRIDDVFFGKYVPYTSQDVFSLYLGYEILRSGLMFLSQWLILSGIAYLALKSFSGWNGNWKDLLSILGYVYAAYIVIMGVFIFVYLLLPPLYRPVYVTPEVLNAIWIIRVVPELASNMLFLGWASVLCAIALRKIQELSMVKSCLMALGAVVMSVLLSSFLA